VAEEGSSFNTPAAFGRFRVLQQLGVGSLGPVFRASDAHSGDPVAVQALQVTMGPERTRIVAEALQDLVSEWPDHPALLRPIDAGVQDGVLYVAVPLVAAEPLDAALSAYGPADIADALPRLRLLGEGLGHAAVRGIWHGALHTGDVLVSTGETYLTGLGIAPILERVSVRPLTHEPYTPPEVATHGSSGAADQFALAAIAHEWIFGARVSGPAEWPLELPSLPDVEAARLSAAFSRALAPDPADRFESCAAFVDALAQAVSASAPASPALPSAAIATMPSLADIPVDRERPPTTLEWRASGDRARRFTSSTLVAVLLVGVATGVPVGYWLRPVAVSSSGPSPGPSAGPSSAQAPSLEVPIESVPVTVEPSVGTSARPPVATASSSPTSPTPAAASPPSSTGAAAMADEAAARPAAPAARLLIRSTPSGATVAVDGASRGATPLALRDLAFGTRTVVISRPGFVPAERRVTLTVDRPSRSVEVALVSLNEQARVQAPRAVTTGSLIVDSRPAGATVTIDGAIAGTTPLTVAALASGPHAVRIERRGYQQWSTTVDIKAGERARVAASLLGGLEPE
jgi:serine/threonine-protein kinase